MEHAVERFAGLAYLAVALSHLLRPKEWFQFFALLRSLGAPGAFVNGMMSLSMGALIVGFHGHLWHGWPAVVTFVGWAQLVKGTLHLAIPALSLRSMAMVSESQSYRFAAGGLLMIPMAAAMLFASTT